MWIRLSIQREVSVAFDDGDECHLGFFGCPLSFA